MGYDPSKHRRRSIRLHGHDYAAPGTYFVTLCVQGQRCLFGTVQDGELILTDSGRMVQAAWETLSERFPTIQLDAFVVMPNHMHGLIALVDLPATPSEIRTAPSARSLRLGEVVGAFKSLTTIAYMRGVHDHGWVPFDQRLWQRNYYEHIVRDEGDLGRIRAYIQTNPARWEADKLHPDASPNDLQDP